MKLTIEKLEIDMSQSDTAVLTDSITKMRLADAKMDQDDMNSRRDLLLTLAELLLPLLGLSMPVTTTTPADDAYYGEDLPIGTPPPEENLDAAVEGAYEAESSYDTSTVGVL